MPARKTATTMWDNPDSLTLNEAAPIVRTTRARMKARRAAVYIVCALCVLTGFVGLASIIHPIKPADAAPASSLQSNTSPGKAAAYAAVTDWLAATPAILPGGSILSWNGYTVVPKPKVDPNNNNSARVIPTYRSEIDYFTLTSGTGSNRVLYTSTVQVNVDAVHHLAQAASTPTLMPTVQGTDSNLTSTSILWPGYAPVSAPGAVSLAVKSWVKAFTSGDANTLLQTVGDQNGSHSYLPLTGVKSVAGITLIGGGAKPDSSGQAPTRPASMLVQVSFDPIWSGQKVPKNQVTGSSAPTLSYDLLINQADTASPHVVAWGGAGTGLSLSAYSNALTGVSSNNSAPLVPTETPTPQDAGGK